MIQQSHCWAYTLSKPELKETCVPMFIPALFTIARTRKQPRCPSADESVRMLWYIYTMDYYSAIKKNAFESLLMKWMKLEPIIQSEVSHKEKHQYSILTHIYMEFRWRRKWHPTPVFLPGESCGWRSLVGCCPWGHTESDTTEAT